MKGRRFEKGLKMTQMAAINNPFMPFISPFKPCLSYQYSKSERLEV